MLLEGPASIRLEKGNASVLGAPLTMADWVVVREDRQIPVETSTSTGLEVKLGHGSKYKILGESTIPVGWREASQLAVQSPGTIAIVGDVDSGKSTLCTFLANECFRHGLKVGIIDGDIGQADIGPPTTISSSRLSRSIFSLQDLSPETSLFIGDTSPSTVLDKLSLGLVRLRNKLGGEADVLLVNTDGWVRGDDASRYKLQLLAEISPSLVLGIATNGELDSLLELQGTSSLKLSRSAYARTRNREERKKAREFGYKRFLQTARRHAFRLGEVRLRRFDFQQLQMSLDTSTAMRGILAGLLDEEENLLSIGRVEKIGNDVLTIRTVLEDPPRIVEFGAVALSPNYEELSYGP